MTWCGCVLKSKYTKKTIRAKKNSRMSAHYGISNTNQMAFLFVLQYHFRVAVHFAFVATAEDVAEDMGFAFEDDGGVAFDGTLGAAAEDVAGASFEGL